MENLDDLEEKLDDLRSQKVDVGGTLLPMSVVFLDGQLEQTTDAEIRVELLSFLAEECFRTRLQEKELEARRQLVRECPEEPTPLIHLAQCLGRRSLHAEAKKAIQNAVQLAESDGRFLRYALGEQARVAIEMRDADLMSEALTKLIEMAQRRPNAEDIGWESDFIKRTPTDFVAQDLVDDYLATKP